MADRSDALFNSGFRIEWYHIPSEEQVAFKAFITEFSEDYPQNWDKETVIGRNDAFHNFENTERVITLGWKVVAGSFREARANQRKVSKLIQMGYPSYDEELGQRYGGTIGATSISESPLLKLKFMNLVQNASTDSPLGVKSFAEVSGLPGRTDGFTVSHIVEDGYISKATERRASGEYIYSDDASIYPKTIQINCTFYALHDHALGWRDKKFRQRKFPYGEIVPDKTDIRALGNDGELLGYQGTGLNSNYTTEAEVLDARARFGVDSLGEALREQETLLSYDEDEGPMRDIRALRNLKILGVDE